MSGDQFETGRSVTTPQLPASVSGTSYSAAAPLVRHQPSQSSTTPGKRKKPLRNKRNRITRIAGHTMPRQREEAEIQISSTGDAPDRKRNKLGYHRTSVACSHCRRRKIRCLIPVDETSGRCSNCIRLKRECHFYPVEQSHNPPGKRPRAKDVVEVVPSAQPSMLSTTPSSVNYPNPMPRGQSEGFVHFSEGMNIPPQQYQLIQSEQHPGLGIFSSSEETPTILQSQLYDNTNTWTSPTYRHQYPHTASGDISAAHYSPASQWKYFQNSHDYRPASSYSSPYLLQTSQPTQGVGQDPEWPGYGPTQVPYASVANESDWINSNPKAASYSESIGTTRKFSPQLQAPSQERLKRASTLPTPINLGCGDNMSSVALSGAETQGISAPAESFDRSASSYGYQPPVWADFSGHQQSHIRYSEPGTDFDRSWL